MNRSTVSRRWRPVCAVLAERTAHEIATERTERTAGAGHRNDPPAQPFELATILERNH